MFCVGTCRVTRALRQQRRAVNRAGCGLGVPRPARSAHLPHTPRSSSREPHTVANLLVARVIRNNDIGVDASAGSR